MRKLLVIIVIALLSNTVSGQKTNKIEVDFNGRFDKHADYTTRFGNRSYTNDTKLWGTSFGVNFNYIYSIAKQVNAKIGIGYYKLGVDKIRQTTPFNTIATGRNIDYVDPSGNFVLYGTDKYHYDNLAFTFGLAFQKRLTKKLDLVAGGDFNYLFTFSQLYHISGKNVRYRTNNSKMLGFMAHTSIGILKKFQTDKYYISPKVIIPIYQQLRGDEVFEDKALKLEKWFNGGGLSFTIGKYL